MSGTNVRIRKSIFMRLVLSLSLVTIATIALVVFVLYKNATLQFERSFFDYNAHILDSAMQDFEHYLEELGDFSLALRQDEALIQSLLGDHFSYGLVADKLNLLSASRKNLGIKHVEYYLPQRNLSLQLDDAHFSTRSVDYHQEPWFQGIDSDPKLRYVSPGYQQQGVFFSYYRSLIDFERKDKKALIVRLDIDPQVVNKISSMAHLSEGEMLFFFEKRGNLLYTNAPSFLIQETAPKLLGRAAHFSHQGSAYLSSSAQSADGGFLLVKVAPSAQLFRQMRPVMLASVGIALFFIILAIALTYAAVRRITRGVYRLLGRIDTLPEAEPPLPTGDDEIGVISLKLNDMTRRIQQLVQTERRLALSEQKALQKALEARVNPHFLYNSLQAISGKAYQSGDQPVCEMIDALSKTYRYVLGNAESATVCDEIENIKNYIAIGQLRFGERLRLQLDVDDMALEDRLPRLSLQTLVENSMKYALEQDGSPVLIQIRIRRRNERLSIAVEDNGAGLDQAALAALRRRVTAADYLDEGESSTGLHSLYGRLSLMYPGAAMDIHSVKGQFFRVTIALDVI